MSRNFYPLNSTDLDPINQRGEAPEGFEVHKDIVCGAMEAGRVTVTVQSDFGKGLGEVYGALLLNADVEDTFEWTDNDGEALPVTTTANIILGIGTPVEGSNDGEVNVDIVSPDAASTEEYTVSFILFGRKLPITVS